MTHEESGGEGEVVKTTRRYPPDADLIAALQRDIDAAWAAGDRLAASAEPEAVPLPVVRLPMTGGDGERP